MSKHETLFQITDSSRDGISFSIPGQNIPYIKSKKVETIEVLQRLIRALEEDRYPFHNKD